ncbi:MAG TPA: HIT domain-containing protein [Patescibacteria group bacterium]|nr:HIT domain-containing protein [Patescibacteria group bacterium]
MAFCIFCEIAKGTIESAKVWEDDNFLAFLDINPNTKGMTIVISKDHHNGSYIMDMDDKEYSAFFLASKRVSQILEKGLSVERVILVMEGLMINHPHIKLYPAHGLQKQFEEILADETVYFEKYEGYISTRLGPKKELSELQKLATDIKEKNK